MVEARSTSRLRRYKAQIRADRPQPCRRCGQDIDYDAPPGHPNSLNVGHIKSWRDHPELREDPANLQPEHERCNKAAGADDRIVYDLGLTSRAW